MPSLLRCAVVKTVLTPVTVVKDVVNVKMNATIPGWIIFFSYIAIIAMLIALLIIGISNQNSIHIPNPSLKIFKNK